jgi:hypothetical protein
MRAFVFRSLAGLLALLFGWTLISLDSKFSFAPRVMLASFGAAFLLYAVTGSERSFFWLPKRKPPEDGSPL